MHPEQNPDSAPRRGGTKLGPPRVVFGRISRRALLWVLGPAALILLFHAFVLGTLHVAGLSMADTLEPGDLVLVSKVAVTRSLLLERLGLSESYRPERGDVVALRLPRNPSLLLVKRVVGLPGDRVVIEGGVLKVTDASGREWPDPEVRSGAHPRVTTIPGALDVVVPSGALFVVGDNRTAGASSDSRDFGSVPLENVIGRVVFVLLPLDRAGPV